MSTNVKASTFEYRAFAIAFLYLVCVFAAWNWYWTGAQSSFLLRPTILSFTGVLLFGFVKYCLRDEHRRSQFGGWCVAIAVGILVYGFVVEPGFQLIYFGYVASHPNLMRSVYASASGVFGVWSLTLGKGKTGFMIAVLAVVLFAYNFAHPHRDFLRDGVIL